MAADPDPADASSTGLRRWGRWLLEMLAEDAPVEKLAREGVAGLVELGLVRCAGLYRQQQRSWQELAWAGKRSEREVESLVAEATDREGVARSGALRGLLLSRPVASERPVLPQVLVLEPLDEQSPQGGGAADSDAAAEPIARWFAAGLAVAERAEWRRRRCRRLETMLPIAARWSSEENSEALLEAIAAAATELFDAERASIFLHDPQRRVLVGRPALGVEGNRLEVPDSQGIVGAVLQSGRPRRWHRGDDREGEVNRSVDRELGFVTESLLAVPLWDPHASQGGNRAGAAGRPLGVFELINRRQGAFAAEDELELAELAEQATAAIRSTQLKERLTATQNRLVDSAAEEARMIGEHPVIEAVRTTISRVAGTDLSVLVLGENGTGKEVLARSIHFQSARKHQPFVAVNCAALVESLLESELFGHEKGAFTDAHQMRPGKFEQADGGTLFLDEIGDLSGGGQAKLLRALEAKEVVRVGGSQPIPVDVRVIAATNQPLLEMVREKRFREDLYFRLNVVTIDLPPLRERGEDTLLLAEHFLDHFAHQVGRKPPRLGASARARLLQHDWPGNIRELRNLMERVAYLCPQQQIEAADLELSASPAAASAGRSEPSPHTLQSLSAATREFQVRYIEQAIVACGGNMSAVAEQLGVQRSNLYRKMRHLGIDWQSIARGR
jgi:DNA-binding NtrC family response regulator